MTSTLPSPGTYLRIRREAQRLSIDDVAALVRTEPSLPLASRADLLRSIEADIAPIGDDVIGSLMRAAEEQGSFRFDPEVLVRLIDIAAGDTTRAWPRLCRRCACSEHDACNCGGQGGQWIGCHWVEPDLCSACTPSQAAAAALQPETRAA
ncbi:XRE family transcriptional regulator [Sphingomonas sp. R647]|uniref:helix-turn-helix domain-containing protein n=1 Tax=Sphingomonas sp. R647 TaxID=2875233 RepID=UPI001CD587AC|nr:XRE family transcriptional regulator [Sphingomonas sp. R647]MCA1199164.1 XRE family transcriptional regulator [Sphingomonas sp. R647]